MVKINGKEMKLQGGVTLSEYIEGTCYDLKRIAVEMTSGVANAIPLNYKKNDPCRYCTMKPICRRLDSAQRR